MFGVQPDVKAERTFNLPFRSPVKVSGQDLVETRLYIIIALKQLDTLVDAVAGPRRVLIDAYAV